ncbi:MAG: HPr family phosphocarrier protein [Planctomycetaceae bacterium]
MRQLTVDLEHGLHVVPCSEISKLARSFEGQVRLIREEYVADAKSMLDLLQLNAPKGTVLVLEVEGDGADLLADQFDQLFRDRFETSR